MIDLLGLETWVCGLFEGIGENTYFGKMPKAVSERKNDYVLITTAGRIKDFGGYKALSVAINAVVRDRQPGLVNANRISEMVDAILAKIPATTDNYSLISPSVLPIKGITGFSYASISVELRIKK
jgi:hypothetical protein